MRNAGETKTISDQRVDARYEVLDATDERAIVSLEGRPFDAAVCIMGAMSMPACCDRCSVGHGPHR